MTNPIPDLEPPSVERTSVLSDDASGPPTELRASALAALMDVRSPSLAPLVRVAPLPGGVALTHRLPAGTRSLAELRRGAPLRAGHVLTVALAVVDALAALAAADLAHGGVSTENVLVAPDGSVVLAAAGLAWRRPPGDGAGPRPADDVAAVGDLVRGLLGPGSAPASLVLAALRASDPDPLLRPGPVELRTLLTRCGRADPLVDLHSGGPGPGTAPAVPLPDVAPAAGPRRDPRSRLFPGPPGEDPETAVATLPRRPGPGRPGLPPRPPGGARRPSRRRRPPGALAGLLVPALALLVLGAVRVGARAAAEGPDTAPPARDAVATSPAQVGSGPRATPAVPADAGADLPLDRGSTSVAPDWPAVLAAVDAGRRQAIVAGSVLALRRWVDPTGSAWSADAALAARVAALHVRVDGGALVVLDVRSESVAPGRSVLLVRDRRDAYSVATQQGESRVPARAPRWWRVVLVRDPSVTGDAAGVWRVHDVAPVGEPPAGAPPA